MATINSVKPFSGAMCLESCTKEKNNAGKKPALLGSHADLNDDYGTFLASDIDAALPVEGAFDGSAVRATHWLTRTTLGVLMACRAGAA